MLKKSKIAGQSLTKNISQTNISLTDLEAPAMPTQAHLLPLAQSTLPRPLQAAPTKSPATKRGYGSQTPRKGGERVSAAFSARDLRQGQNRLSTIRPTK